MGSASAIGGASTGTSPGSGRGRGSAGSFRGGDHGTVIGHTNSCMVMPRCELTEVHGAHAMLKTELTPRSFSQRRKAEMPSMRKLTPGDCRDEMRGYLSLV